MKKLNLLSVFFFLSISSCYQDEIKKCPGLSGGGIEAAMLNNGAGDLAAAMLEMQESGGILTKISCGNGMGRNNLKLGAVYVDKNHTDAGNLLVDDIEVVSLDQNTGHFKLANPELPVLNLFGSVRTIVQKSRFSENTINTCSIKLPKPFSSTEGGTINVSQVENSVNLNWSPGLPNDSIFVYSYVEPNMPIDSISNYSPSYFIKKVPDNGQFSFPSYYLNSIPMNSTYSIGVIRLSFTLYEDGVFPNRKNIFMVTTSAIKLMDR